MQVILLDKVANLGSLGDQVNVKAGYARNFLVPQGKAVPATKKNVEYFEARRAELEANWLTFWAPLKLAQPASTNWALLPSRLKQATKVNCSALSVPVTSLTQLLRQVLRFPRAKFVCQKAFCALWVNTKWTSRFTATCLLS